MIHLIPNAEDYLSYQHKIQELNQNIITSILEKIIVQHMYDPFNDQINPIRIPYTSEGFAPFLQNDNEYLLQPFTPQDIEAAIIDTIKYIKGKNFQVDYYQEDGAYYLDLKPRPQ